MVHSAWKMSASIAILALGLAGCGGSGGSGGGSLVSTPPPPSVPPPPPPPPPPPAPPIGLTQQASFPTLSISSSFSRDSQGRFEGPAVEDLVGTTQFHYLASEQAYEVVLPGLAPGRLETTNRSGNFSHNIVLNGDVAGTRQAEVGLLLPGYRNGLDLTFTSYGLWESGIPGAPGPHTAGAFAYGMPTATGDVPMTGTGSYDALVSGTTLDLGGNVEGRARLLFDFGSGSLSGYMDFTVDPWSYDERDFARYDFTQTVFGAGGTTFSGRFLVPGTDADSFFQGQFTGPAAVELMARWSAPFFRHHTQAWTRVDGVWVGRRE